ncbi:tubulin-like doman-containing protein [Microcystis aeruginosa CS-563/04]|uniref:tubulin-like doman-containing protein n=1 Tax=Microcystis aeruginosa TaxID=1126 RepID=UPI00232E1AA2|nr:tubulin-like doman-containing protein [Microcystis aeruginosa]MDB9421222.1 tubulin-like doman-containing protein [Microcystis aeruginosa CS-563/04]
MPAAVEEKSMVPTVLVGIGGTGNEILSRLRRLIEESYGSLSNFPIVSFLVVDTDKDYKISNPEAAGSAFKDNEKHWSRVSGKQVQEMVSDMDRYPWINSWFPPELERNITSLEAGAGQIRACGRFALFCNYHEIQRKFLDAVRRVKGQENFMLDRYGIKVSNSAINVFTTGSLNGGTGSGMLIDIGYCIRNWLRGESSPLSTAIVPTPEAFAGISVGDRVLANGYAALMELNYFSDYRTEYHQQFSSGLVDEVVSKLPPFDFTYLVGTKNGESDFKLGQIREMIAQNIFLDLTSDFAPHKRSIRDNIKGSWAQADPGGRGYPKQFMSFGLSTIEIPIAQIRASLSERLAKDLINWWLNDSVILPAQMLELVRGDILKKMRLSEGELIMDLCADKDRSLIAIISQWTNETRQEINQDNWLSCTKQGVNILGNEQGKILQFINDYLTPRVEEFKRNHLLELSPDERLHGDYLKKIYNNRDEIIQRGKKSLEMEFYNILEDRNRGVKFAESFIVSVRQIFTDIAEKFRRDQEQVWSQNESKRQREYDTALAEINDLKDKIHISKKDKMEQYCEQALTGLEGYLMANIQRKTRGAGVEVINRLLEHLNQLESRFNRFRQKLIQSRDLFNLQANQQIDSADALLINGIKLFDRQELNSLYQDFIEQFASGIAGNKNAYDTGMDNLCLPLSEEILKQSSPLWKETRRTDENMRLFDITEIADIRQGDFQKVILNQANQRLQNAPASSRIQQELAACDRLLKIYNNDADIINNLRIAYQKSRPLIMLNPAVLRGKDAGFTPQSNQNVALIGGRNTSNPAAQKIIPKLREFIANEDDIKPLGEVEKYRLVFVQEIGGFSLRCLEGMRDLRQSYQDWKGEFILAKRAQQMGENRDLPIPVHIQKEPPFWDVFPEDPSIYQLVVTARALKVLFPEVNRVTNEKTIRYEIKTATGLKKVDIATSWEDAVQVLEVKACREDKEKIQSQVTAKLQAAATPEKKQALYRTFIKYLQQRSEELTGGKDNTEYKREDAIILQLIDNYKLDSAGEIPLSPVTEVANPALIICGNCGHKNPPSSNFCSKCGSKLVK